MNAPKGTNGAQLAGRLLVVDFDYFFVNPNMQEEAEPEVLLRYDWQTRETPFHADEVWYSRVTPFWANGLELPTTLPHKGFWSGFAIDADYPALIGDSNMHAGSIFPSAVDLEGDGWEEVWLYDAHHDSGYKRTRTLEEFIERDSMTCEDWMLNHAARGSKLRVRYPHWRAAADGSFYDCEPPPAVEVDRALDDGQPVADWFDAVYICRSGSWVPSWCDDAFEDFVADLGMDTLWIDEFFPRHRSWDEARAREQFEIMQKARDLFAQKIR